MASRLAMHPARREPLSTSGVGRHQAGESGFHWSGQMGVSSFPRREGVRESQPVRIAFVRAVRRDSGAPGFHARIGDAVILEGVVVALVAALLALLFAILARFLFLEYIVWRRRREWREDMRRRYEPDKWETRQ